VVPVPCSRRDLHRALVILLRREILPERRSAPSGLPVSLPAPAPARNIYKIAAHLVLVLERFVFAGDHRPEANSPPIIPPAWPGWARAPGQIEADEAAMYRQGVPSQRPDGPRLMVAAGCRRRSARRLSAEIQLERRQGVLLLANDSRLVGWCLRVAAKWMRLVGVASRESLPGSLWRIGDRLSLHPLPVLEFVPEMIGRIVLLTPSGASQPFGCGCGG